MNGGSRCYRTHFRDLSCPFSFSGRESTRSLRGGSPQRTGQSLLLVVPPGFCFLDSQRLRTWRERNDFPTNFFMLLSFCGWSCRSSRGPTFREERLGSSRPSV